MVYILVFYVSPTLVIGIFIAVTVVGLIGTLVFNKETKDVELTEV